MNDAIVTIQGDFFDIVDPSEASPYLTDITTYVNLAMFTKPWWGNPYSGTDLEIQTDGINSKKMQQNVEIILGEVKQDLKQEGRIAEFEYKVGIMPEDALFEFEYKPVDSNLCFRERIYG